MDHRVLTTPQVADIGCGSMRAAQQMLARLRHLQVLDRWRPPRPPAGGSAPYHWVLAPIGAAIIADRRATTLEDLGWRPVAEPLTAAARAVLDHRTGANSLFTNLLRHARLHGGTLEEWLSEPGCRKKFRATVVPDGYGVWAGPAPDDADPVAFFLEHDTGTEALAQVAGKLAGYDPLVAAQSAPRPIVAFRFLSPAREINARAALRDALRKHSYAVTVATAVLPLRPAAGRWDLPSPADAIWLPITTSTDSHPAGRVRLAALPPSPARPHQNPGDGTADDRKDMPYTPPGRLSRHEVTDKDAPSGQPDRDGPYHT